MAAYIAEYATKAAEAAGGVTWRSEHEHEISDLRCREHARRLIASAWRLRGRAEFDGKRLRRWAHQLGYGGHCFTKSRRYSTTFRRSARPARPRGRRPQATRPRKVPQLDPPERLGLRRTRLSEGW